MWIGGTMEAVLSSLAVGLFGCLIFVSRKLRAFHVVSAAFCLLFAITGNKEYLYVWPVTAFVALVLRSDIDEMVFAIINPIGRFANKALHAGKVCVNYINYGAKEATMPPELPPPSREPRPPVLFEKKEGEPLCWDWWHEWNDDDLFSDYRSPLEESREHDATTGMSLDIGSAYFDDALTKEPIDSDWLGASD